MDNRLIAGGVVGVIALYALSQRRTTQKQIQAPQSQSQPSQSGLTLSDGLADKIQKSTNKQSSESTTDEIPFSETPTQTQQRERTKSEKSFVERLDFSKLVIDRERVNELITSDSIDPTLDTPQMIYERYGKAKADEPTENVEIAGRGRRLVIETVDTGIGGDYSINLNNGQVKSPVKGTAAQASEIIWGGAGLQGNAGISPEIRVFNVTENAEIYEKSFNANQAMDGKDNVKAYIVD